MDAYKLPNHIPQKQSTISKIHHLICLIIYFVWTANVPLFAESHVKIIFRPFVEISSEHVYLGDIAQIQTNDEDLRQRLEAVKIKRIKPSGPPRTITLPHVKSRIAQQQLDPSEYTYVGDTSVVQYKPIILSSESILAAANAFYQERLLGEFVDAELQVEPETPIIPIHIPHKNVRLKFVPLNNEILKGTLEAQVIHKKTILSRHTLKFQMTLIRPVVVATQNIPPHAVIQPEQVKLERRAIKNSTAPPMTKLIETVGKISATTILQGSVINTSLLQKQYLVPTGSIVTIVAQRGALKVQTKGVALENGERGQLIRVINSASKKELKGEVIGDKLVRIRF